MILLVEDERDIRRLLRTTLEMLGHEVIETATARDGLHAVVQKKPDLILLDLGLPDRDGQDFIVDLREWSQIPLIVISARDEESEKVRALENGADDYLTKPFSNAELAARIKVALRHGARAGEAAPSCFEAGGLRVDYDKRLVVLDGVTLRLTPIEYKLLLTLTRNAGKALTHGYIAKEVWGRRAADGNQTLRIHMQHLREKLNDDPLAPRFIMTEPGIGYRLMLDTTSF
jgi:two-component system, OmpR family, KDP operon response regulator KdpE